MKIGPIDKETISATKHCVFKNLADRRITPMF